MALILLIFAILPIEATCLRRPGGTFAKSIADDPDPWQIESST